MKELGQYFTKNKTLQNKVYEFILNNPKLILEPSVGRGDLVKFILNKKNNIKFKCYEIDNTIDFIINTNIINFNDFLKTDITNQYKTIIGNPPYIRTKKGNLYIDFINKCVDLLENNGELIFIIPSDFFKLTSAIPTIKKMMDNGSITHIFHPHNESLFENATIDIIVFRYCKDKSLEKQVMYNNELMFINESGGLLFFSTSKNIDKIPISKLFNIYVGMITAKENVYKNKELGNINFLNNENNVNKYIYITEFPSNNKKINNFLLENKEILLNRKIRKFNEKNWFEWGAPRNVSVIENNINKECIYVKNITRNKKVAFKGKVMYFGGSLLMLLPKQNNIDLDKIIDIINDKKTNFEYSGRFKIGHRQLSSLLISKSLSSSSK